MALKQIRVRWTGIRPLIMNNGQGVDSSNPLVIEKKGLTSSNKGNNKTEANNAKIARLDWEIALYFNPKLGPFIPSDNIERCIQLGAQKTRLGKQAQAAVFCADDSICARLEYDGPRQLEKLYADQRFQLRRAVTVGKSRVMKVRPMFPTGWTLNLCIEFDESVIGRPAVVRAMVDAGSLIGLGDWRPKFGRFLVEEINES